MNVVAFRVDSSHLIGTGHVMRCLSLAEELRLRGCNCIFVSYPHKTSALSVLRENGFSVLLMEEKKSSKHESMDSFMWLMSNEQQDADEFLDLIPDSTKLVVVDHYSIGTIWHKAVRRRAPVVAIDDLANRPISADILIDHNLSSKLHSNYALLCEKYTKKWLGLNYLLIRRSFISEAKRKPRIRNCFENILVFMGGADHLNCTETVLECLLNVYGEGKNIKAIVGHANNNWLYLVKQFSGYKNITIQHAQNDFARILGEADLAIGGVGGSAYERAVTGTPSIGVILAENQRQAAFSLQSVGATWVVEYREKAEFKQMLISNLRSINEDSISKMSSLTSEVFGNLGGCEFVAKQLDQYMRVHNMKLGF